MVVYLFAIKGGFAMKVYSIIKNIILSILLIFCGFFVSYIPIILNVEIVYIKLLYTVSSSLLCSIGLNNIKYVIAKIKNDNKIINYQFLNSNKTVRNYCRFYDSNCNLDKKIKAKRKLILSKNEI